MGRLMWNVGFFWERSRCSDLTLPPECLRWLRVFWTVLELTWNKLNPWMREGIITAMITHSAVFSAVSLHDPCLGEMCGGFLQPLLHLPALADDTSLSSCLWWPAGSCHLCALVTSNNTSQLSLAPLARIKKHSCDPCCQQSLWGHRQGS